MKFASASAWIAVLPSLAALGSLYLLAQLSRNSVGVIAGDLESAFGMHASQTAAVTGAMFLGYAAAQIPGALLVAVYGPTRILPLAGGLLCAGLLAFSVSQGF